VAVRGQAVFVIVPFSHFTSHGRAEDLAEVEREPSQLRRRRYDINPMSSFLAIGALIVLIHL